MGSDSEEEQATTKLASISISERGLNNKDMEAIVRNNSSLTSLYFCRTSIGDAEVKNLAFLNLSALTSLDFFEGQVGPVGMGFLSRAPFSSSLTELYLYKNQIGPRGMGFFSLGDFSSLTSLNLDGNTIGDKGVRILSRCKLPSLESLGLDMANIGNEGPKFLLAFANFSSSLTSLNLDKNYDISDTTRKTLKEKHANIRSWGIYH